MTPHSFAGFQEFAWAPFTHSVPVHETDSVSSIPSIPGKKKPQQMFCPALQLRIQVMTARGGSQPLCCDCDVQTVSHRKNSWDRYGHISKKTKSSLDWKNYCIDGWSVKFSVDWTFLPSLHFTGVQHSLILKDGRIMISQSLSSNDLIKVYKGHLGKSRNRAKQLPWFSSLSTL